MDVRNPENKKSNERLKITQLEEVRFINVNELKLTEVELFLLFHFKFVAANVFELFCAAHFQIMNAFYAIPTFHFEYKI